MPHNDLLMQYSAYSLLLSTSVSETFGLSVAEAIAHGTPVVGTDSGGVRDFVNEGNGLVVDIRDVDGIVDAIIKVISAQFDSKNMSQRILEKYGNDQYVNCADLLR
jgi:glycosyltransferase involved in cell wall biosynthesis